MPTSAAATQMLLINLARTRRQILDASRSLTPAQREAVFLGTWSARHLLAHLIGWDIAYLKAVRQIPAGELPDFYAAYDRDWAGYNAQLVERYGPGAFARLVSRAERSHSRLMAYLQTVPADEIWADHGVRFRGYKVTIERLLKVELSDERTHLRQLKQFARARDVGSGQGAGRKRHAEINSG